MLQQWCLQTPNMDSSPLKINMFHIGWNNHLDHVQKIYHMYSWWKKLRQISVEICAKKQREMAKNKNSGKIYGGSHLHSRRTLPWQRRWLLFKQFLKSPPNFLRGFSSCCTILQHHSGHSKTKIPLGNSTVSGVVSLHHFLDTSTPCDLKGWNGPRTLAPTRGKDLILGWRRWDGNLGMRRVG